MGELITIVIISGLICGVIGVAIARNKRVSGGVGFLLGAFFGPLGLIIVALLNPANDTISTGARFIGHRDASTDGYRLWLTQKYSITRNETLGRYVVRDSTFGCLDEAIAHADHLEGLVINTDDERAVRTVAASKRLTKIAAAVVVVIAIIFTGQLAVAFYQHRSALQNAENAVEDRRKAINAALSRADIKLHPEALMTSIDYRQLTTEKLLTEEFIGATNSPPSGERFDPCSVEIGSTPFTDWGGRSIDFYVNSLPSFIGAFYQAQMKASGYQATSQFGRDYVGRDEYTNKNNIVFVSSFENDDGPTRVNICLLDRKKMDSLGLRLSDYNKTRARQEKEIEQADRNLRNTLDDRMRSHRAFLDTL